MQRDSADSSGKVKKGVTGIRPASRSMVSFAGVLWSVLFLFAGCSGCGDEPRFARMIRDTSIHAEADRKSEVIGTVPAGQLVEITGPELDIVDGERKWFPAEWKGRVGFILLSPGQIDFATSSADESVEDADSETEGTEEPADAAIDFEPESIKPARFDPDGLALSMGIGCTGSTYSEYSIYIQFSNGRVQMREQGLLEYGMPGESCSSSYEELYTGTYEVREKQIVADFTRKISRDYSADFPNCNTTRKQEKTADIERQILFHMLECDGKKALQMSRESTGAEGPQTDVETLENYFVRSEDVRFESPL